MLLKVLAVQGVQDVVPGEDQVPRGQQMPAPLLLNLPIGQGRGAVMPVVLQ